MNVAIIHYELILTRSQIIQTKMKLAINLIILQIY